MTRYDFPSRLDLRHLRYFVAVAEEENFHRASERLHVVQSALSRRIIDLEQQLALTLFDRSPKGAALTEAGRTLLDHARRIVGEADRAKAHMRRLAMAQAGTLKIGMNRVAPQLAFIPETFRRFRAAYPDTALELLPMTSQQQIIALLAGELDFGFLNNQWERVKEFSFRTLFKDYFILALPADHALAQPGMKIRLRDIADEDFVLFTRAAGPKAYDELLAAFAAQGLMPRIVQEGYSEDAQLGLVAAGMGLSFTFSSIISRYHRNDLVFKPVEDLDVDIDMELVWRSNDESPLVRAFLKVCAEASA